MVKSRDDKKIGLRCIMLSLYFFAIPLEIVVSESGSSYLKLITAPIGLFFVIAVIFSGEKLYVNSVHFMLFIFTLSAMISLIMDTSTDSLLLASGYLFNAALFIFATLIPFNRLEQRVFEFVQIALLIILIVITLNGKATYNSRTTISIGGHSSDPNYFCGFFILPISVTLKQVITAKHPLVKLLFFALLAMSFYTMLLSGSRGGTLAVALTMASASFLYPKKVSTKVITLFVLAIVAVVAWTVILPLLPETISGRLSVDAVVESKGSNRADIWVAMIKEIWNSGIELIFGRGLSAKIALNLNGKVIHYVAHNQLLQVTYTQGLIGLLSFLMLVGVCILRNIKSNKHIVSAMVGMLMLVMTLSLNPSFKIFWNLIAYSAINDYPNQSEPKNSEKKESEPDNECISPV